MGIHYRNRPESLGHDGRRPPLRPDAERDKASDRRLRRYDQILQRLVSGLFLAAESMGLGAVWTAVYPYPDRIEIVRKELQLPDHIMPLNVIPVGYPMQKEIPKNKYNAQQIHHNGW